MDFCKKSKSCSSSLPPKKETQQTSQSLDTQILSCTHTQTHVFPSPSPPTAVIIYLLLLLRCWGTSVKNLTLQSSASPFSLQIQHLGYNKPLEKNHRLHTPLSPELCSSVHLCLASLNLLRIKKINENI